MKLRYVFLTAFFGIMYGLLGANLYRLQILKSAYYVEQARARSEILSGLELRRGGILATDRYGKDIIIALNRDYPVIFAVPKEIKDPSAAALSLAPIIGGKEEAIVKLLNNSESLFRLLLDKAAPEQVNAVSELRLPGVYIDQKQYRYYPYGRLASQILGFVGVNSSYSESRGLYGVEKLGNDALAGGDDVRLTIDRSIQASAEQALEKLMREFQATGGTVIVQEPFSGKIVALANAPDFDPNAYADFQVKNFINPAVQLVYEPGSVFKPFTMVAGIDLGILTPQTTFFDSGSITLNGRTIRNADFQANGRITTTDILEHSINIGAVLAEQKIGHKNFVTYLEKFGFGEKTGIDLPDEVAGSLRNVESADAQEIDFATASFGQGTAVTPVQMITAFSALANGGLLMRPYLNRENEPYVVRRVMSGETAQQVAAMLEKTVQTAGVAVIPNYRVAGKTGTALIPDFEKGGYSNDFIHTFVGFAPVSRPAFTILFKLDRPAVVGYFAGRTVVPAFRELAQFILNYYAIPPDAIVEGTAGAATSMR